MFNRVPSAPCRSRRRMAKSGCGPRDGKRESERERERERGREVETKRTDDDASKIDNTGGCKRLPTALTSFFSSFLLSAVSLSLSLSFFLSRFRFPCFRDGPRFLEF